MVLHFGAFEGEVAAGKAKSVQAASAETLPAPESPTADDGRRRLRARRARAAEPVPDWIDELGPRSPSSGESDPESDAWRPPRKRS